MKNLRLISSLIAVLAFAITGFGQGTIVGSSHDFSGATWNPTNGSTNEICIVCHTPHQADASYQPLWDHSTTIVDFSANLYSSTTFDGTATNPQGTSRLCLSCHDGTVALENFGGTTTGTNFIAATAEVGVGGDLSHEHPISFDYLATHPDVGTGLSDPDAANANLGGSTISGELLFGGSIECGSCHDVHNNGPATAVSLLRVDNSNSDLCRTCHTK